jgi:hypothetical protein
MFGLIFIFYANLNTTFDRVHKFNIYGTRILNIFQYISNKTQLYTVYLYLETVHVSVGTSTHHQERIKLYLQHLLFVIPLLLSAAIADELELQSSFNSSTRNM